MEKLINTTVVKIGSSSLVNEGKINTTMMGNIARQINLLKKESSFVIITSGAIASGKLTLRDVNGGEVKKQVLAAVGQRSLLNAWGIAFDQWLIKTGLFLFAESDLDKPTLPLQTALECNLVPIINANDTVSVDEIEKLAICADNDRLACFVASSLLNAQKLILLTEEPGVLNSDRQIIRSISAMEDLLRIGNFGKTDLGIGGIESKILEARRFITSFGKQAYIASASENNVLLKIMSGEDVGTKITLPLQSYFQL